MQLGILHVRSQRTVFTVWYLAQSEALVSKCTAVSFTHTDKRCEGFVSVLSFYPLLSLFSLAHTAHFCT